MEPNGNASWEIVSKYRWWKTFSLFLSLQLVVRAIFALDGRAIASVIGSLVMAACFTSFMHWIFGQRDQLTQGNEMRKH